MSNKKIEALTKRLNDRADKKLNEEVLQLDNSLRQEPLLGYRGPHKTPHVIPVAINRSLVQVTEYDIIIDLHQILKALPRALREFHQPHYREYEVNDFIERVDELNPFNEKGAEPSEGYVAQ